MRSPHLWVKAGGFVIVVAMTLAVAPDTASGLTLSAGQMAGQRVIYSYTGLTPPAKLLWLISHGEAAGVIFFGDNITSHKQIRGVIQVLEHAAASPQNPVHAPLLLMTDQEGGLVRRLSGAPRLSEKQIGASADPATLATKAGRGAGRNLRGVGMNVNLAPVLDVYRKAGDFDDQYGRSYSKSPGVVSKLGAAFIRAQQHVGVAATAKHFPGLGAATRSQNTDMRPVTLQRVAALAAHDRRAPLSRRRSLPASSWSWCPGRCTRRSTRACPPDCRLSSSRACCVRSSASRA